MRLLVKTVKINEVSVYLFMFILWNVIITFFVIGCMQSINITNENYNSIVTELKPDLEETVKYLKKDIDRDGFLRDLLNGVLYKVDSGIERGYIVEKIIDEFHFTKNDYENLYDNLILALKEVRYGKK